MKPANVIRSLDGLQTMADTALSLLRARHFRLGDYFSTQEFVDFWRFYKELSPFLQQFAKESEDEMIGKYVHIYCDAHMRKMDSLANAQGGWFSFIMGDTRNPEEVEIAMRAMVDNIGNLKRQVEITIG